MQLLTELLVILDNMECNSCKLKNQCEKMKEEKDETLCKYLFELDERKKKKKNDK